jgi:hypothetical protein
MSQLYLGRAWTITCITTLQLIWEVETVLFDWGLENDASTSNHNESAVTQINSI